MSKPLKCVQKMDIGSICFYDLGRFWIWVFPFGQSISRKLYAVPNKETKPRFGLDTKPHIKRVLKILDLSL